MKCKVHGCVRVAVDNSHGFCTLHLEHWKVGWKTSNQRNTCVVENCGNFVYGHGFCQKHYARWKRTGDPFTLKRGFTTAEDRAKMKAMRKEGKTYEEIAAHFGRGRHTVWRICNAHHFGGGRS